MFENFFLFDNKLKLVLSELNSLKKENSELLGQIIFMRESIEYERQERQKLSSLIFKKAGYEESASNDTPSTSKPLGRPVSNWSSIRKKLELSSKNPYGQLTEEEWKKKEADMREVEQLIDGAENAN